MELIVVMAIIGLVLAIGVPGFAHYNKQLQLNAATRNIVGLLSLARSTAISTRSTRTVDMNPQTGTLTLEAASDQDDARVIRLSSSLTLAIQNADGTSLDGESPVVFQPSGALSGRSVLLVLSGRNVHSQTIRVVAATGAISVDD